MAEAYSKPCQISKMMGDIENPDIEQFIQYFQAYKHLAILNHVQTS